LKIKSLKAIGKNQAFYRASFAVFGAFMVDVSAAGVAEFHTAKGQDCAACHADGNLQVQMFRKRLVKNVTV